MRRPPPRPARTVRLSLRLNPRLVVRLVRERDSLCLNTTAATVEQAIAWWCEYRAHLRGEVPVPLPVELQRR